MTGVFTISSKPRWLLSDRADETNHQPERFAYLRGPKLIRKLEMLSNDFRTGNIKGS